jgi:hypothetical protein
MRQRRLRRLFVLAWRRARYLVRGRERGGLACDAVRPQAAEQFDLSAS